MKRDKTGRFIPNWNSEAKHIVNLSLTQTAWQRLDEHARQQGISPSELVEAYARSLSLLSIATASSPQNGCVAKTYKGETIGIVCIPLNSNSKNRFDKFHSRHTVPLFDSFYLSFPNHVHRFDSAQRAFRAIERLESHHRFHNPLDVSMILLNDVIEIFALP